MYAPRSHFSLSVILFQHLFLVCHKLTLDITQIGIVIWRIRMPQGYTSFLARLSNFVKPAFTSPDLAGGSGEEWLFCPPQYNKARDLSTKYDYVHNTFLGKNDQPRISFLWLPGIVLLDVAWYLCVLPFVSEEGAGIFLNPMPSWLLSSGKVCLSWKITTCQTGVHRSPLLRRFFLCFLPDLREGASSFFDQILIDRLEAWFWDKGYIEDPWFGKILMPEKT